MIKPSDNKRAKTGDISQSDRFKQAAKDVGADESEAEFEAKLKRIAEARSKGADKK